MRVAVVPDSDGGCWASELAADGSAAGTGERFPSLSAAAAAFERRAAGPGDAAAGGGPEAGLAGPAGVRWVWPAADGIYPAALAAGTEVDRCHDLALVEALLLAREGCGGEPATLAAAWARSRGAPVPGAHQGAGLTPPRQAALFEPADPVFATPAAALTALIEVHAGQTRRIAADPHPDRFALLAAAESAAGLVAAEMRHHGLPWRADVHAELLTRLLGAKPSAGMRPARLASLAGQIAAAFGGRPVNPDSPAQVLRALAADGVRVPSTRSAVLREVDHPAAPLLLEYKELARLYSAHGWAWLAEWVRGGRFHPEYVVGGVVSGRWASRGGGALQIPRVMRRAVIADPGWALVVADAAQLEPRVLAALSGDGALADAAGAGDLYEALAGVFSGDRGKAKIALLSAMYGGAGGEAGQLLAVLRNRFPAAAAYVAAAARAGEEGGVVRSRLGRTCPPPSGAWRGLTAVADDPATGERRAGASVRARGRFTRNFVVQASAADWATVLLALLRRRLAEFQGPDQPRLVFFQHDEVIVHCPADLAAEVAASATAAADEAGRLVFGDTPVRFPLTPAVVECYADAK